MKSRKPLLALVLLLIPGAALSEGCHHGQQQTTMSCAEGHVWDEAAGTCVLKPSS